MSIFYSIDDKLVDLSSKLNATLSKDRPDSLEAFRTFEERRIDWIDDQLHKAIIIQPKFERTGVNSSFWSIVNVAWPVTRPFDMRVWTQYLLNDVDFGEVESEIDELLQKSVDTLQKITNNDLK